MATELTGAQYIAVGLSGVMIFDGEPAPDSGGGADALLLESGDYILLESGDRILIE